MATVLKWIFIFSLPYYASARDLDKLYSKARFKIGGVPFEAYVADSESLRADGLMFIKKLPENTGMLFIFDTEQPLSFWMKNTLIPLAIGFIDAGSELVDIQEMTPAKSLVSLDVPTYQSRKPALYALEMNQGWFTKHKVKVGAKLEKLPTKKLPRH